MFKPTLAALGLAATVLAGQAMAADYVMDTKDHHAFINFKISHLGFGWVFGTFKDFSGTFSFDEVNPEASKVAVKIKTTSLDTGHAERDKHLRGADFLNVSKFPEASFVSTGVKSTGKDSADISGDLTLNGVTKPVVIKAKILGEGNDPWGGYRVAFDGSTTLKLKDYNVKMDLGPASQEVELTLSVEGIRQ